MSSLFERLARPTKTFHHACYPRLREQHGFEGCGKTVLITGGSSSVGMHCARAFAGAGVSRIILVARNVQQAQSQLAASYPKVEIIGYNASVTDYSRMQAMLDELAGVEILVLAAAAMHERSPASKIATSDVQIAFDTNTIATFHLTKSFLNAPLPAGRTKTVINISSAIVQVSGARRVGYAASKAATAQCMQYFAHDNTPADRVRIFSLHPGALYSHRDAKFFGQAMDWDDVDLAAYFILWLCGGESDFLHGRHIWANWDVEELIALQPKLLADPSFLTIGLVQ